MNYVKQFVDNILDQKIEIFDKWVSAIEGIHDYDKVAVWGTNEHTEYLLKCTDLGKKNITWIDRSKTSFQGHKVYKPNDVDFSQFDHVVIGAVNYRKEIAEELLTKYHYQGNIVNAYAPEDKVSFYRFLSKRDMGESAGKYKRNLGGAIIPDEIIAVLRRIVAVRKRIRGIDSLAKIAVYCSEEHIEYLMRYTDLTRRGIVCFFADEKGLANTEKFISLKQADLTGVDVIVLAKLDGKDRFVSELRTEKSFTGEVIDLYASEDITEFYQCAFKSREEFKDFESKVLFQVANEFCHEISSQEDVFVNFKIYNKFSEDSPKNYYGINWQYDDTVIVIQGPVKYEDDFTYHTILQYYKIFPGVHIVLSAWKEELKKERFKLFKAVSKLHIVLCDDPEDPGALNVNRQMYSTYKGLEYAYENLNVKYALKIRSDSRLYSPEALELMKTYAGLMFKDRRHSDIRGKIVCSPLMSISNRSYYFADYYNFGNLEDMLKFWDPVYDEKCPANKYISPENELKNPEKYLYSRYAYKYISPDAEAWGEYREILKNYFAFLSLDSIDFMWNEYQYSAEERRCATAGNFFCEGEIKSEGVFSYAEWLNLITESND